MIPIQIPVLTTIAIIKVAIVTVALLGSHWLMRDLSLSKVASKLPWRVIGLAWSIMLILLLLTQKSSGSFIYFQF